MPVLNPTPTLDTLPPPPPGKTGWPWTESSQPVPAKMPNGSEWPLISIVTPSYNQGEFIEETIRSVLLQGYPSLEYIIIDGGSSDRSLEVIKKYGQYLSYWVSEPDKGPADAINKGWQKTSGAIIAYLNSDDVYFPTTLATVAETFQQNHGTKIICGNELKVNQLGLVISKSHIEKVDYLSLLNLNFISQPATFIQKSVLTSVGTIDREVKYTFDFELWLRITRLYSVECIPKFLAVTRWHTDTITLTQRSSIGDELVQIITREINNHSIQLERLEKRKILFQVHRLAMKLHLENQKMLSAAKYAAIAFYYCSSFHLAKNITKQYLKSMLRLLKPFRKKPNYLPNISEPIHWSSLSKSTI